MHRKIKSFCLSFNIENTGHTHVQGVHLVVCYWWPIRLTPATGCVNFGHGNWAWWLQLHPMLYTEMVSALLTSCCVSTLLSPCAASVGGYCRWQHYIIAADNIASLWIIMDAHYTVCPTLSLLSVCFNVLIADMHEKDITGHRMIPLHYHCKF